MPPDRRYVKIKWVFEIKRNGIFHARLVACGYSKIAGVDYTANYAPVINDVTWRVIMIVMLLKKYDGKLIDIGVVFLHGNLEEEMYIDCPQRLEDEKEDEYVKLLHTIYGLVQSARQFWKKLVNGLKNMGLKGGYPDPYLLWKKNDLGMVVIALYMDGCLCIRDKDAIASLEKEFVNAGFQVNHPEELSN